MATDLMDPFRKQMDEINAQLKGFDDLVAEREKIQSVIDVWEGKAPANSSSAPTTRRRRRSSGDVMADHGMIVKAVNDTPDGVSAGDIREIAGLPDIVTPAQLSTALKELVEQGKITKTGERRSTRYFPV